MTGLISKLSNVALAAGVTGPIFFVLPALAADFTVGTSGEVEQAITDASVDPDGTNIFLSNDILVDAPAVFSVAIQPQTLNIDTTGGRTLTLNGVGTVWDAGRYTYFGIDGSTDGGLTLSNGAKLTINDNPSNFQPFGILDHRSGNLTVTGEGSSITSTYLAAGRGADSTITITDGAHVTTTSAATLGEDPATTTASNITVLVDGEGTVWNAGYFAAGGATDNVDVTLSSGATIETNSASIGRNGNASMLVTGADTSFAVSGDLYVGERSPWIAGSGLGDGELTISDGGLVSASSVRLGMTGTNDHDAGVTGALVVDSNGTLETGELAPGLGTGTATFNNGTLRATNSEASLIHSFEDGEFVLQGSGLYLDSNGFDVVAESSMSGDGALTKQGAGKLTVTGHNTYGGETDVTSGTLAAGAVETFSANSAHRVAAGALLDLQGYNQTVLSLENAGTVNLGGAPGTILTVSGDYVGEGGVIFINTALGDDSSVTDRVDISGVSNGTGAIRVTNVGGAGGQTVEGIRIIDVAIPTNSSASFSLLGDYVFEGDQAVVGGAYAYRLYKGSISDQDDGDWYLRSTLIPSDPGPVDPTAPLYQAGAPVYEAYPQVLLGLNGLPTLQQRVGNRFWSGNGAGVVSKGADMVGEQAPVSESGPFIEGRGVWGRIEAAHATSEPDVSTTGAEFDYDQWKLQAGIDFPLIENDAGMLLGGVTTHYGRISADVSSFYGNGSISTDGYGVGGTLTWYGKSGFYIDAQAQYSWYGSDLTSDLAGRLADGNDGEGYALSLEAGKRIDLHNGWTLTPQVQLAYSAVDFDSFADPFAARVSLLDGDSLRGRLGVSFDREASWQSDDGTLSRSHLYGIANVYHEFLDGTAVDLAGVTLSNRQDRLWAGVGAGGSYNWNDDRFSLYGEGSVNTSVENFGDSTEIKGTLGFRVKW